MLKRYGGERGYRTTYQQGVQFHRRGRETARTRFLSIAAAICKAVFSWLMTAAGLLAMAVAALVRGVSRRAVRLRPKKGKREHAVYTAEPVAIGGRMIRRGERAGIAAMVSLDFAAFCRVFAGALGFVVLLSFVLCFPAIRALATSSSVSLLDDATGLAVNVTTTASSVGEFLDQYGVRLESGDIVYPDRAHPLDADTQIHIRRAFTVLVRVDGQSLDLRMQAGTVRDALAMLGVAYTQEDIIQPALDERLIPGTAIEITRVVYELSSEEHRLYFYDIVQQDKTLYEDQRNVLQEGSEGKKEVVTRIEYRDGEEFGREVVEERVLIPVQHRMIAQGTKPRPVVRTESINPAKPSTPSTTSNNAAAAANAAPGTVYTIKDGYLYYKDRKYPLNQTLSVSMTAYTHTGQRTASGTWPGIGTIAVDPSVIPMGTLVFVPGYGMARAEDKGGGIKGNKIDVFLNTEEECIKFGRKFNRTIYIVGSGKPAD